MANWYKNKIGEIFGEIKNKISSGYNLRKIIDHIDELRFRSQTEKHELSHLYEAKIRNMGNAGRNGGEYYTPRPLIRTMVRVIQPQIGECVYDGALGSAGFLREAFEFMKVRDDLTTGGSRNSSDPDVLREREEVAGLCHRDHEYDPARHRDSGNNILDSSGKIRHT